MLTSPTNFLEGIIDLSLSPAERAVALLWWHGRSDPTVVIAPKDLAREIQDAVFASQNVSRLSKQLSDDPRTTRRPGGKFAIKIDARRELDERYNPYLKERPIKRSDSIFPTELFEGTRGYIEKVVVQINASYDHSLYDCCAVMCRRLLETLIIEVYEAKGRASKLKGPDGHFQMFSSLLSHLENDTQFNLARDSIKGLKNFKNLGDQSAHNRRFNARKQDIDRIRDGARIAAEELLHLASLA